MLAPLVRQRAPWLNAPELAFATESVRGRRNARRAAASPSRSSSPSSASPALIFGVQARRSAAEALVQQQAATEAAAQAQEEEARAEAEATRAGLEKQRAVRSLFSSLKLYMSNGNAGSVCVYPGCVEAPPGDGDDEAWFSIGRLPESVPNLWAPTGHESREFIVARDYGAGHVLVYAQDGLTRDDEVRGLGADNLTFAENALRWLDRAEVAEGCPDGRRRSSIWPGTFLQPGQMTGGAALRRSAGLAVSGDEPGHARRRPALCLGAVVRQRLGSAGGLRRGARAAHRAVRARRRRAAGRRPGVVLRAAGSRRARTRPTSSASRSASASR